MSWDGAALSLALAVPLAWLIDHVFGEPRNAFHPVAWFGRVMRPVGHALRKQSAALAFTGGAIAWLAVVLGVGAGAWLVQDGLVAWRPWLAAPVLASLLKPSFAWRMLDEEVFAVEVALDHGLVAGRQQLSGIVSRDVTGFGADEIRETAIESLAENLNDSVVAPLFWYAVLGLPGAAMYRVANTLDAMWGYHGPWEWAGKWSARADDVLSWLPARFTAVMLMLATGLGAWRRLRSQARLTPSPNSGWPMAAMALCLGVRLGKPGVYVLNDLARSPRAHDVAVARRLAAAVAWLAMLLSALSWFVRAGAG